MIVIVESKTIENTHLIRNMRQGAMSVQLIIRLVVIAIIAVGINMHLTEISILLALTNITVSMADTLQHPDIAETKDQYRQALNSRTNKYTADKCSFILPKIYNEK